MNTVQKLYVSKLISASYRLGMQLQTKDENGLTQSEKEFMEALNMCAHYNVSGDELLKENPK